MGEVAEKIIDQAQTVFMNDRYIMEGVIILHDFLNDIHKKKDLCVVKGGLREGI
jgi:hypothetical protein